MKILSNFKDYYDYVTFAGGDFKDDFRDNIFKRTQGSFLTDAVYLSEVAVQRRYGSRKSANYYHCDFRVHLSVGDIIKSKWWESKRAELSLLGTPVKIDSGALFVCGKVYPFIYIEGKSSLPLTHLISETVLTKYYKYATQKWSGSERKYIDGEQEIRYRKTYFSAEEFLEDVIIDRESKWQEKNDKIDFEKSAIGFFEGVQCKNITQLHIAADTPILKGNPYKAGCGGSSFGTNPCLYAYGFERIMSAEKLCQELDMFISNFLVKDVMPPSYQSDFDKVTSHGFDAKTSFRSIKEKK